MKVRVEVDETLTDPEVVLRVPSATAATPTLMNALATAGQAPATLRVMAGETAYWLPLGEILFIETADRHLQVHTKDAIFTRQARLYEVLATLPGSFMQVAKSAVVNLGTINALTRSLSSTRIEFAGSYKQLYASRRYAKALETRLKEMRES